MCWRYLVELSGIAFGDHRVIFTCDKIGCENHDSHKDKDRMTNVVLRAFYQPMPPPEEIDMYTRAYMLDLFSTVMFLDQSGYIQTMYIQFLRNITDPPRYSWGLAVLACLYRALCDASYKTNKKNGGQLILL
jgi:Plant mobile domain